MDRGAWRTTVHGVAKSPDITEGLSHTHTHTCLMAISVMLIFLCQLDEATRYPDVGPNIILGVSVRVFLDEIYI